MIAAASDAYLFAVTTIPFEGYTPYNWQEENAKLNNILKIFVIS